MKIDLRQQELTDKILDEIIIWLERKGGMEFTSSSIHRKNDSGVHGCYPSRGNDLICRIYTVGKALEEYVNNNWQYDYTRLEKQVAIYHDTGGGYHLHLQSHPNTRKRNQ
jgi:hypothetical protein